VSIIVWVDFLIKLSTKESADKRVVISPPSETLATIGPVFRTVD
jgi:hypothetical protein